MRAIVALSDAGSDERRARIIADGARDLAGAPASVILHSTDRPTICDDERLPLFDAGVPNGNATAVVPIALDGRTIGTIAVAAPQADAVPIAALRLFADAAARALGAAREVLLKEERERRAQERATLAEAARTILSYTTLRPLADAMCRLAAELVNAPRACATRSNGIGFAPIGSFGPDAAALSELFASRRKRMASANERYSGDRRRVRVSEGEGYVAVPLARTSGETGQAEAVDAYLIVATPGERYGRDAMRLLQELGALFALALRNLALYQETARANAALRESSEFKDDLIAMLAHDFKGPLTVVLGYCELLLEAAEGASDEVEMIFAQTQRLVRLSEDALVLAQTQADGFSLARSVVDFGAFVREALADSGPALARVRIDVPEDRLMVSLDPQRFGFVIDNLISNALKYSDDGVDVAVRHEGDRAVFEVTDRGIGIPEGELQSIFMRFGRASNARRRGVDGTGVGLYVSRKIVDVHRGSLAVRSREGEGSTFTVALPLATGLPTSVAIQH